MFRGIISPPRSRSSPRPSRPNAAGNPPSKRNYLSPLRRQAVATPNELRSQKKEGHTNVKASAMSISNHTANSSPTNRSYPKPSRPSGSPRFDASKPTKPIVPSRRPSHAPNPNDLPSLKKDNHASSKITSKTSHAANIRPSSPRTVARNAVQESAQQKMRRNSGIEPPPTTSKPSQPRGGTISKNAVKGAIASGSKSDISSAIIAESAIAKDNENLVSQKFFDCRNNSPNHITNNGGQQVVNKNNAGNHNRYLGGLYTSISDPEVHYQINSMLGCGMESGNSDLVDNEGKAQTYGNHLGQLPTEPLTRKKIESMDNQVDNGAPVQSPEKRLAATSSQTPLPNTDLANIVLYANSTYEVGSGTKERCSQKDAPRIFQIYRDISTHRQGTLSITSYFTKLKAFWDELASYSDLPLCSCGAMTKLSEHGEREKVMQFLVGLSESYFTVCEQILLMEPFPTIEKTYSLILREEKRRELLISLEIVAAKLVLHQNDQSIHPNDCTLLSNAISKNTGDFDSTQCNVDDHTIEVRNQLDGFPHEYNLHKQENQETSDPTLASACSAPDIEVPSFSHEPMLIDLGSPLRC